MDEIIKELTKPVWWVSVVIVGIIINLGSAYLKSLLDNKLSAISSWWQTRSEYKKVEWQNYVSWISESENNYLETSLKEIRQRNQSNYLLLIGLFLMVFVNTAPSNPVKLSRIFIIITMAVSSVSYFFSFLVFTEAAKTAKALRDSSKLRSQT